MIIFIGISAEETRSHFCHYHAISVADRFGSAFGGAVSIYWRARALESFVQALLRDAWRRRAIIRLTAMIFRDATAAGA